MIVCIFGLSCVGKTIIARHAAVALGLPLRSCGDAIRKKAETLDLPIDQLPDEAHRAVDAASVEWALERRGGCMLEGRFLDAVFTAAGVSATLIELRANRSRRVNRAYIRHGLLSFSIDDLDRMDAEDADFRARLFRRHADDVARHMLDTSCLTVDECARRVQEIVKASNHVGKTDTPEPPASLPGNGGR
jgi:cytidylate kinase